MPVVQNVQGTVLYDVRDTGQDVAYGARFSVTSAESSFHTDNSFGATIVDYVGLPCVLKDAHGGGWKNVSVCRSLDELLRQYNKSGLLTMVVQEFVKWEKYVRCLCVGQQEVLPMPYDPNQRRYIVDPGYLDSRLRDRLVGDSLRLVKVLGYDMNSVEWAVRDGIPYAIDFMNPAPDMDVNSLTPVYFEWCVKHLADTTIALAQNPRTQLREMRWATLF